ncbi:MAG: SURF1 family cytochrome oxidase biogenesis protein [Phenylobacterium sp.]|jgi:surfeit locus 1 family protein|uniref:SURF1 family protein n=1 Tax=Phenylobacterium sp. TaxID=1871053 RepID=UPI002A371A7F|nr:SURF1 family cytochrome oxidase biogenesis protein [Phenylobacterium sp.]MDX9997763.1 SURF1 family cytochrome oxidase biogenesis protein [Phenylobacterium sp.]
MSRRLPIGLTAATLVALCILIGLGVWQVQRMAWKQDLLARIAALEGAPPTPAAEALAAIARGEDREFHRVRAVCPGLSKAPWLELYGLHEGRAGVRLISACRLEVGPYGSVLVDRGFVPDMISARPPRDPQDQTPVVIDAVVRTPETPNAFAAANTEQRWFRRDVAAMAKALGAERPAPVFLMAETSTNPEWAGLTPSPVPVGISNRHLEYALTWFGLAGALIAVYAAVLWRRWKMR